MACRFQDITRRSAADGLTPAPQARDLQGEVVKLVDVTTCISYKACQAACSRWNDIRGTAGNSIGVYDNPNDLSAKSWTVMRFSRVEQNNKLGWSIRKGGCMYCSDPGCLKTRPAEGAITRYANGIVNFQSEQCINCDYRTAGCPFDVSRLSPEGNHVYKYTLYADRMVIGQEPAYAKTYPTGAIHLDTKEPMRTLASEYVAKLKTCDYDNAGLHDPAGVDDTHIMCVLHHANKPNLYHGLSGNSETSEAVKFWKGTQKPLTAVGFAAILATSVFRYMGVDPNHADEGENNLHEGKGEKCK